MDKKIIIPGQNATQQDNFIGKINTENLVKYITFISVMAYIIGLLVVNSYLFQIGISDISAIKAKYIYTGTLTLIFFSVPLAASFLSLSYFSKYLVSFDEYKRTNKIKVLDIQELNTSRNLHEWRLMILGIICMVLIPTVLSMILSQIARQPGLSFSRAEKTLPGIGFVDALQLTFPIMSVLLYSIIYRYSTPGKPFDKRMRYVMAPLIFFSIFGYTSIFSNKIYPIVPEQFGGGQPKYIKLLVNKDKITEAAQIGIEFQTTNVITSTNALTPSPTQPATSNQPLDLQTPLSKELKLVFEDDKSYVLWLDSGQIIRVDKSIFIGTQIIPSK